MGKYDSPYFNTERYYDPTAGAVLVKLAQEEKKKYYRNYDISVKFRRDFLLYKERPDPIKIFAYRYAKQYEAEHGRRKSGKPKALANPTRNSKYIRAYLFCMDNANAGIDDADLEKAIKAMYGLEGRRVKQCFTRTGDLGKLINAWIAYTEEQQNAELNK